MYILYSSPDVECHQQKEGSALDLLNNYNQLSYLRISTRSSERSIIITGELSTHIIKRELKHYTLLTIKKL